MYVFYKMFLGLLYSKNIHHRFNREVGALRGASVDGTGKECRASEGQSDVRGLGSRADGNRTKTASDVARGKRGYLGVMGMYIYIRIYTYTSNIHMYQSKIYSGGFMMIPIESCKSTLSRKGTLSITINHQ